MKVLGADRIARKFRAMPREVRAEIDQAQGESAAEMVRISKLLHPGDGPTRAKIHAEKVPEGWLVDFGDKAKVTEGDSGPRPHIAPTIKATAKRRGARAQRAARRAVKRVFGGG